MSKKDNFHWFPELSVGTYAALLGLFGTAIAAWLSDASSWLWHHLHDSWAWPNWITYLLLIAASFGVLCLALAIKSAFPKSNSYEADELNGVLWRWRNSSNGPVDLRPFCTTCDSDLIYQSVQDRFAWRPAETVLYCTRCGKECMRADGDFRTLHMPIINEIKRIIRSGEWQRRIRSS